MKPEDLYRLQPVTTGDIEQNVTANGTINPVSLVNVGTQVSGRVKKIYADYNDRVKQGQVLLELEDELFKAQIAQSLGNVKNNEASLELAKANELRNPAARNPCPNQSRRAAKRNNTLGIY